MSSPAIIKAIPLLEKMDYLHIEKDKETKRYSIQLNLQNHRVMQFKRVDNLKQIYEFGFVDFLELEYAGATIILFGSYSRGEDLFNSDIDIAIIGRKDKDINLEKYEYIFKRKIHLLFFESFKKINEHLKNNILNGIIIHGGVEL